MPTMNRRLSRLLQFSLLFPLLLQPILAGQPPLSDDAFERLSLELSENNGFFPTDNLVSNETSYLHVVPDIRRLAKPQTAYLGVGPEQNFSYIVHSKPEIAFILDIRRDNMIHHLWIKELFRMSDSRWKFLSLLLSRPLPADRQLKMDGDTLDLVRVFEDLPATEQRYEDTMTRVWASLKSRFPKLLNEGDEKSLRRIAYAFYSKGMELTYEIPGRPELGFFPSYGSLMVSTDKQGNLCHYLSQRENFLFLKDLEDKNLLIPVVGNFAGSTALKGIGAELRKRHLTVSVFYLSNVEFYLFRNATLGHFMDNVATLPIHRDSILIRSYFNQLTGYRDPHPFSVAGHLSVSLCQRIQNFINEGRRKAYTDYWDLVTRDYIHAKEPDI